MGEAPHTTLETYTKPDGSERQVVHRINAVGVIALRTREGSLEVLLCRQHRRPVGVETVEIVAGTMDVPGEAMVDTARRELAEEAGMDAGNWQRLFAASTWPTPGWADEEIMLYAAWGLTEVPSRSGDSVTAAEWWTVDDALDAISVGRIRDAKTIIAVQQTALYRVGMTEVVGEWETAPSIDRADGAGRGSVNQLVGCPGCAAAPDTAHEEDCDHACCPDCGEQLFMHDCDEWADDADGPNRPAAWHGVDPTAEVAHQLGWWTTVVGINHPVEDYTRVNVAADLDMVTWDPENQRYVVGVINEGELDRALSYGGGK